MSDEGKANEVEGVRRTLVAKVLELANAPAAAGVHLADLAPLERLARVVDAAPTASAAQDKLVGAGLGPTDALVGGLVAPGAPGPQAVAAGREALLARAYVANELAEQMKVHIDALAAQPEGTYQQLERLYGRALGRILTALGGLPADDAAVRAGPLAALLARDPAAREAALKVTPTSHPELFEILLMSLTSPGVFAFLKDGAPRAAGTPTPREAAASAQDGATPAAAVGSTEASRDAAARQLAERARYFIPLLITPEAPPPDPRKREEEPHVDRVQPIRPIKKR